jgi:hypothetical protein
VRIAGTIFRVPREVLIYEVLYIFLEVIWSLVHEVKRSKDFPV